MWLLLTLLRLALTARASVATIAAFAALSFPASGLHVSVLSTASERRAEGYSVPNPLPNQNQPRINSFSFCKLVRNPNLFSERTIRTSAILVAGYEQYFLYSPRCNSQDKLAWAEHDPKSQSNPAVDKQLESLLSATSVDQRAARAEVGLLGRLVADGPKRFGHLDQFRMKFVIIKVERAKPVSPKTAWPSINGIDTSVDRTVRELNKEFILHVAGASSYAVIPSELLADNFRFTATNAEVKSKLDFLATSFSPYSGLIHDTDIEVRVRGDSAIVTGLLIKSTNDSGDERYRYTVRYVQHNGTWQITTAQLTNQ